MKYVCLIIITIMTLRGASYAREMESTLYLSIQEPNTQKASFFSFSLKDKAAGYTIPGKTDLHGQAVMTIITGRSYELSTDGGYSSFSFTAGPEEIRVIKVWKLSRQRTAGEKQKEADTLSITSSEEADLYPGLTGLSVKLNQKHLKKGCNMRGEWMYATELKTRRTFRTKIDSRGSAYFQVPIGSAYSIGTTEVKELKNFEVPRREGGVFTFSIEYERTCIDERVKGDTVYQKLKNDAYPTTGRALIVSAVKNYNGANLPGEALFFKSQTSGKIYVSITDESGTAYCLLPKGDKYLLSLKYESAVDLLDVPKNNYMQVTNTRITYHGTKAIEKYMAEAKRDARGFKTEFLPVKIKPIAPQEISWQKTGYGKLGTLGATAAYTPQIINNHVYFTDGYYGRKFSHKTGTIHNKTDWTVELAEAGASPVSSGNDSFCVFNTESCSIYVLDARTGQPIWAHWLSPILFCTPLVQSNKVYTVYSDDGGATSSILICFDLRSGNICWQQRMPARAFGKMLFHKGKLFVSLKNGEIFCADANTGAAEEMIFRNVVGQPVISGNTLYAIMAEKSLTKVAGYDLASRKVTEIWSAPMVSSTANDQLSVKDEMDYFYNSLTIWENAILVSLGSKIVSISLTSKAAKISELGATTGKEARMAQNALCRRGNQLYIMDCGGDLWVLSSNASLPKRILSTGIVPGGRLIESEGGFLIADVNGGVASIDLAGK